MLMIAGCNGCDNSSRISIDPKVTAEYPGVYVFLRVDGVRGTCFVVDYKERQFLVTAKHLIAPGARFLMGYEGEEVDIVTGDAGIMRSYDIAVMQITGAPYTLKIAPEKLRETKVYAVGYTTLHKVKRSAGKVVGNRNYVTKAELRAGMSGGPLLNELGEVIGINSSREMDSDNVTFIAGHHADIMHAINIMDKLIEAEAKGDKEKEE
jgi:S1-C subfamily serine protease